MITEQIKYHFEKKKYARITRRITKDVTKLTHGFILGYNEKLALIQETEEFTLNGYSIIPISDIVEIRFNKSDKYYHKILKFEGIIDKVGINYLIDISSWSATFESIKLQNLNVIIECEHPDIDTFTIGPIENITKKKVDIYYFDAAGYFDDESTPVKFKNITRICFDDRYTNTFSKYLRHRKPKKDA